LEPIFSSFLQAGFECSTHKLRNGRRLDLVASTRHDRFVNQDYDRLVPLGIQTVREGLRWHLIEQTPGTYDFASAVEILRSAQEKGIQVIWDLFHFGWPDHLQIFEPSWVSAFADFANEFARLLKREMGSEPAFVAPVNEVSFVSWAGGDAAHINPYERGRGIELKVQLIRAAVQATQAVRAELPNVRLVSPEPAIHIVGNPEIPDDVAEAEAYRMSMFQAWDMLAGRIFPELNGHEGYLDIIGVNYYDRNQWWNHGTTIFQGDPHYRPFRQVLKEVYDRYHRPIFVSETGTEDFSRPGWFAYVCSEVREAVRMGVPVHGICLYPILNHPGWDDDRHCHNGLWDYALDDGSREIYLPLANEIHEQETIRNAPDQETSMEHKTLSSDHTDLICLSHLRWQFVFQRPQHLMSRFARHRRVFYIEEPIYGSFEGAFVKLEVCPKTGVCVGTPHLPEHHTSEEAESTLRRILQAFFETQAIHRYMAWFYTPMALNHFDWLKPEMTVYDCMDELSLFQNAPPQLRENERRLFQMADLVFTGGVSLFEAKRNQHPRVYAFPSSVDVPHFAQARSSKEIPADQAGIPSPRLGYAGVIDERMDLDLIDQAAARRPDWHFVMVGPVVKIDPATLPRRNNIHWLGMKDYQSLPAYFAGWDVGLLPFALNDSTRFISPTKTPEYLAAGLPVVSTGIRDVIRPYGDLGLARIVSTPDEFVLAVEQAMAYGMSLKWRERADRFLATLSWDHTWEAMDRLISEAISSRANVSGIESARGIAVHV
jgi:UDP-galactopyranose mutase